VTEAEQKMLPVIMVRAINKLLTELENGSVPSEIIVADVELNHRFDVVKVPGENTMFDLKYAGSVKTTGMN